MLKNIQSTIFEIRTKLLNNKKIRTLLYNDSNNALNDESVAPTVADVEKYITCYPVYQFENKADYTQNGMVNLYIANLELDEENNTISGVLRINVVFNVDKWELNNSKIRPIEVANEIIKSINNEKFSVCNSLEFSSMQELVLSKQLVGYALLFFITDGSNELKSF